MLEQKSQEKNYESYTKSNRRGDRTPLPSDDALRNSIIPISEIRKEFKLPLDKTLGPHLMIELVKKVQGTRAA